MCVQGVTMEGRQGKFIESTQEMILRFTSEVSVDAQQWTQPIIDSPADLETIERSVHQAYARGADMLVAGLIAVSIKDIAPSRRANAATVLPSAAKMTRATRRGSTARRHEHLGDDVVLWPQETAISQRRCTASRAGHHLGSVRIR